MTSHEPSPTDAGGAPARTAFDLRALERPVSPQEVSEFRRTAQQSGDPRWKGNPKWAAWLAIGIFAVVFPVVGGVNLALLAGLDGTTALGLAIALFVVIVVGGALVNRRNNPRLWTRYLRADEFARANGMQFSPRSAVPNYQGAIFGIGSSRSVNSHVWSADGPVADCGTYRYTTGSGKNRNTHTWQFAAVRLAGPLPHMLLDAKVNNTFFGSNLPTSFHRDQRISLGGEFDEHFDLYCPEDYGPDAFYVFTPDLMAQLIDQTQAFDVEFVDDWMFLYTRHALPVTAPATWQRLAGISNTITARMRDRSRSYTDRRVPDAPQLDGAGPVRGPRAVAPQGRRLRRKRVWVPIVVVAGGWLLFNVLPGLLDGVAQLLR